MSATLDGPFADSEIQLARLVGGSRPVQSFATGDYISRLPLFAGLPRFGLDVTPNESLLSVRDSFEISSTRAAKDPTSNHVCRCSSPSRPRRFARLLQYPCKIMASLTERIQHRRPDVTGVPPCTGGSLVSVREARLHPRSLELQQRSRVFSRVEYSASVRVESSTFSVT